MEFWFDIYLQVLLITFICWKPKVSTYRSTKMIRMKWNYRNGSMKNSITGKINLQLNLIGRRFKRTLIWKLEWCCKWTVWLINKLFWTGPENSTRKTCLRWLAVIWLEWLPCWPYRPFWTSWRTPRVRRIRKPHTSVTWKPYYTWRPGMSTSWNRVQSMSEYFLNHSTY